MSTLLQVNSSILGSQGQSSQLADHFVEQWLQRHPEGEVIHRDLTAEPIPHLDAARFQAFIADPDQRDAEQQAVVDFSDALIGEIRRADLIVMGLPLYNFGVPSGLKAYFDHIARAGHTFRYTANGPEGLLTDRPVHILAARGGLYAGTAADIQTAYVRQFLGLLGLRDLRFTYAEGLNIDPETRDKALATAQQEILRQVA